MLPIRRAVWWIVTTANSGPRRVLSADFFRIFFAGLSAAVCRVRFTSMTWLRALCEPAVRMVPCAVDDVLSMRLFGHPAAPRVSVETQEPQGFADTWCVGRRRSSMSVDATRCASHGSESMRVACRVGDVTVSERTKRDALRMAMLLHLQRRKCLYLRFKRIQICVAQRSDSEEVIPT